MNKNKKIAKPYKETSPILVNGRRIIAVTQHSFYRLNNFIYALIATTSWSIAC